MPVKISLDEKYMKEAIRQARKAAALKEVPIGCVIVHEGKIIGRGYNRRTTDGNVLAHAEILAIRKACRAMGDWRLEECTMYVTLEPCCHDGRQPPCTDAILEAGISRVVVGSDDPNPLVGGKGLCILRRRGVEVETGVVKQECDALNQVFFHFMKTRRPYVVMKYAMTLDGKTATRTGASRWITGEEARRRVHQDRHRYSAIMTGVGTVLADNPLLTCRMEGGRNPVRVICDTRLRTPLDSKIVRTAREVPTILATACGDVLRHAPYEKAGCRVWTLPEREGHVNLPALMERLGGENIDSVLLEGGGTLNEAMVQAGLVQKVYCFLAPRFFGGRDAKTPLEGPGAGTPDEGWQLALQSCQQLAGDLLLEYEVKEHVHRHH